MCIVVESKRPNGNRFIYELDVIIKGRIKVKGTNFLGLQNLSYYDY